jgi:sigma-B regulation protein RsbU (phosphoserine phosphatase)
MDISIGDILIDLIKTACVIIAFAYIVTRTTFFNNILDRKFTPLNVAILIILFGILSIFGTYGGLKLPSGAIANIRDLGPMVAGLVGGPIVGLGAGLIGGIHRYFLGGFVCVPCGLSTVLAGLLGGLVYLINKRRFLNIWQAVLFAVFIELMHMGLTLLIAKPYDAALAVVQEVILPMVSANAIGMAIFAFIISNLIKERRTAVEKEKYRHELERKEFEIETARKIQQSFLPEAPPNLKGFQLAALSLPALQVGGDFYDFIPVAGNRLGIVIADVSGKGVPAALFMGLSQAIIRASTTDDSPPADSIKKANVLILNEARSNMFVTMFYAELDPERKLLRYVNSGHNPPLLYKGSTGDIIQLEAKGIALGVMDEVNFEEKQLALEKDDVIVLYTDGVTEAIDKTKGEFGKERLRQVILQNNKLAAGDIIEKIKNEVLFFSSGEPQFDDITLVILRVTGGGE